MSKDDNREMQTANTSSESAEYIGEKSAKRLLGKSWREKYIRILEWISIPVPKRNKPPFNTHDNDENLLFWNLIGELENSGLIRSKYIKNDRITDDKSITFSGRLEIDRLKSLRPWRVALRYAAKSFFYAFAVVFSGVWLLVWEHYKTNIGQQPSTIELDNPSAANVNAAATGNTTVTHAAPSSPSPAALPDADRYLYIIESQQRVIENLSRLAKK